MSKYLKHHEAILAESNRQQEELIATARQKLLIPYCNRTGQRFSAGMGTWVFFRKLPNGQEQQVGGFDDHSAAAKRIPKTLRSFLEAESGLCRNDLGALMEDYTPPNYERTTP